jgi:hypothetical protein
MGPSERLDEKRVRAIVRDEILRTSRSLIGTLIWTVLSVFTVLLGLQLFQIALATSSMLATVGIGLVGMLVVAASLYLLSLLHWE